MPATRSGQRADLLEMAVAVDDAKLTFSRMASLDVHQRVIQLDLVTQRSRDRPQASDVLGMTPTGIVATAIGVRDVGDGHSIARSRSRARRYRAG